MAIKSKLRLGQVKTAIDADVTFTGDGGRQFLKLDKDGNVILGDANAGVQIDGAISGSKVGKDAGDIMIIESTLDNNDFLKVHASNASILGRSSAEMQADLGINANLTGLALGIANNNLLQANANVSDNDFLRIDGTRVEGRTTAETMADLSGAAGAAFSMNTQRISNLAAPTAGTDAVNRDYVDARAAGLDPKESVYVATTANIAGTYNNGAGTITAASNGALGNIDGEPTGDGERILLRAQADAKQNGIYVITNVGDGGNPYVLTRASDADSGAELSQGVFVFAVAGTTYGGNGFLMSHNGNNENATVGTDNLTFTIFTGAGSFTWGDGLTATGNTIAVDLAADSGLEFNSNELRLKIADDSLERDASNGGVSAKIKANGGIVIENTNGLKIDLAGSAVEGVTRFSGKAFKQTIVRSGGALNADTNLAIGNVGGGFQQNDFTSAATADRELYLNGQLLLEGADASANNDWYTDTGGSVKFEFVIENDDVLQFVYRKT